MKFPTYEEFAKKVAEKALDEFLYDGRSLREWVQIIGSEDAISRQAVFESIDDCNSDGLTGIFCSYDAGERFKEYIKKLPPATPQKMGHWISMNTGKPSHLKDGMSTESVKCSECDEWLTASDEYACNGNYCPNCGIKMEVKE